MRVSELASRYAKSVYEIAVDNKTQEKVFSDLRGLDDVFTKNADISEFLVSPMVKPEERVQVVRKALEGSNVAKETEQLIVLLAQNGRLGLFQEIVEGFQTLIDAANGVARGTVRSAVALSPAERQALEAKVEQVLKKKVIMSYKVDPTVIGGLVAKVGSYTFDDSLDSHLRRMNEELKRRAL